MPGDGAEVGLLREADRQEDQPSGEHLEGRRDEGVAGERDPRGEVRAGRPGDRRDGRQRDAPPRRPALGTEEDRDADEADEHADDREPRRALAAGQAQQHDEQRHRGDDQRCDSRRHRSLRDEEQAVRPGQQQADQRGARELAPGDPQRMSSLSPRDDGGHERAGEDEPRRHGAERRDGVARDLDPEIRRAPDHVDGGKGRPGPRCHRFSVSAAPAASRAIPSARGQLSAICSKPNRP